LNADRASQLQASFGLPTIMRNFFLTATSVASKAIAVPLLLCDSGGVILEYTIYDRTGAVMWSDKLTHYEGYKEPKRIINKKNPSEKEFNDPVE
jgi:hypothetical protein